MGVSYLGLSLDMFLRNVMTVQPSRDEGTPNLRGHSRFVTYTQA